MKRIATRLAVTVLLLGVVGAIGLVATGTIHEHVLGIGSAAKAAPLPRTRVVGMPAGRRADGSRALVVTFSARPRRNSPTPVITPRIRGHWVTERRRMTFVPAFGLAPCTRYRLTVPAGTVTRGHRPLGRARTTKLKAACLTTLAGQQALARLGYLPFTAGREAVSSLSARRVAGLAYTARRVSFVPRSASVPHVERGTLDAVTRGALEGFQTHAGLTPDGYFGPDTWGALLKAEIRHEVTSHPYTWITVTKGSPETLQVHRTTGVVYSTPANTGVPGADTPDGTFPIFTHVPLSDMKGTNVDGTKYNDPGVPWDSYFTGGDAVHGFPRASYGSPQSNGCVELPIAAAHTVWNMVDVGDLVIVSA